MLFRRCSTLGASFMDQVSYWSALFGVATTRPNPSLNRDPPRQGTLAGSAAMGHRRSAGQGALPRRSR
jgi:hypothetical protein